jgi:D-alanyl-D-alanine carboxypeptidase
LGPVRSDEDLLVKTDSEPLPRIDGARGPLRFACSRPHLEPRSDGCTTIVTRIPWGVPSARARTGIRVKFIRIISTCVALVTVILASSALVPDSAGAYGSGSKTALKAALERLVSGTTGPPGAIAVVQHDETVSMIAAGTSDVATEGGLPTADDHVRVASVAKAFSGAAALALVARHTLALDDTIGKWLPDLPRPWDPVTLGELLKHSSGIPDFSACRPFQEAVNAAPLNPPPPQELIAYATRPPCYMPEKPLAFPPGTKYEYSNSDNVIVGLMIQAATNEPYDTVLSQTVSQPLGLSQTSLPSSATMPVPYMHGYVPDPSEGPFDVSQDLAAGWAWASGGVVSTPADANTFVRDYVKGATTNAATRAKQFHFVKGNSEPPGPGTNAAGMAIFRYRAGCGTVYGHTGNTLGFTQFIAASANGRNSVSISVSGQITPKANPGLFPELHRIFELGVCAAMKG